MPTDNVDLEWLPMKCYPFGLSNNHNNMEHKFNVGLACQYGIEEAIMIDNLYYWIKKNVANEKNHYEGRYWTYNTAKAFAEIFPYISATKIYRILAKLEQENVIIKGKFNQDKYVQTNWYSFTDDALIVLDSQKYDVSKFSDHFANLQNGNCENEKCFIYNNSNASICLAYFK